MTALLSPRRLFRRYIAAFLLGSAGTIGLFFAALALLSAADRLPAPPITGTWCIDEKLAWLRDHPADPELIAIGSSVTMRNLDFDALPEPARQAQRLVNAAPCYLHVHQIRAFTRFMLDYEPHVRTVLTVLAPRDFEDCRGSPARFFDRSTARGYLDGRVSGWWLYFRNFRPLSFTRDALQRPGREAELVYDPHGSSPMPGDDSDAGRAFTLDRACFDALRGLAEDLERRGVRLVAATLPVMPEWARRFDPAGQEQERFRSAVAAALAGTGTVLVDGMGGYAVADGDFADPAHLHWPAVAGFTRFVWREAAGRGVPLTPEVRPGTPPGGI
jgi:hypothetical protein